MGVNSNRSIAIFSENARFYVQIVRRYVIIDRVAAVRVWLTDKGNSSVDYLNCYRKRTGGIIYGRI